MIRVVAPLFCLALAAAPAAAEVVKATPTALEVNETVTIDAPPARVWDTILAIQTWWDKEHSYSGDAANLYLDAQATGCFCERLPVAGGKERGGSIEHAHVTYVAPHQMIRMTGALGPLAAEAVTGTWTIEIKPVGATTTAVAMTYVAAGYVRVGADTLAPKVDEVLGHQLDRLKTAAEASPAPKAEGQ